MRGNHEGYVLNFNRPDHPLQGLEFELRRVIYWTYQSLTKIEREQVEALPEKLSIAPGNGQLIRCLHASTAGDRVGIYPYSSAEELTDLVDLESNLFLIGHTHQPLVKPFQETLVVNVGSVGLPFDGDQRAAYAQLEWTGQGWQAEIVRVPYDLSAAADDFSETGFLSEGGPLAEIILTELKLGWPQLNHWFRRFEIPVLQEEISLEDAVKEYQINPHREEPNRDVLLRFP